MSQDNETVAAITLAGIVLTQASNWAWRWCRGRSSRRSEATRARVEERRVDVEATDAAVENLLEVLGTLREDLTRLRKELDEEREARRRADDAVRQLRIEIDAVRSAVQQCPLTCRVASHFAPEHPKSV